MSTNVPTNRSDVGNANGGWVATFTVLDLSGSITASQWRRLSASLRSAWRRATESGG